MPIKPAASDSDWTYSWRSPLTRATSRAPFRTDWPRARQSDRMQSFNAPIDAEGALVDAVVGLAAADAQALRSAGHPVPSGIPVRALVDSGAEVSCVVPQIMAPLVASGLLPGRFVFANL